MQDIRNLTPSQYLFWAEKFSHAPNPLLNLLAPPLPFNMIPQSVPYALAHQCNPLRSDFGLQSLTPPIFNTVTAKTVYPRNFLLQQGFQILETKRTSEIQMMPTKPIISSLNTEITSEKNKNQESDAFVARSSLLKTKKIQQKPSLQEQEKSSLQEKENSAIQKDAPIIPPKKKKNRRLAVEITRQHKCPFRDCSKAYGVLSALSLHIKTKHEAATKAK